jgi:hypothetical protein
MYIVNDTFMPTLSWVVVPTEAEGHRELALHSALLSLDVGKWTGRSDIVM